VLNSDQAAMQIHWLDLDLMQDGQTVDDKVIKKQIEKQMDALNKQEEAQNENYKAKKEELLNNASEREKQLHQEAQNRMLKEQEEQQNQQNLGEQVEESIKNQAQELAIYDNGNVKSKNNQLVWKIEKNTALDDSEKERMLQQHEGRLHNIDNVLDNEKKKQEHELDRALKERLDRRHRMKEKQHGKDIRKEQEAVEQKALADFEQKKEDTKDKLEQEHQAQVNEILTESDLVLQRQQLQDLEELNEQKKRQTAINLEQEHAREIEKKKSEIQEKYMSGANEADLTLELSKLMGQGEQQAREVIDQADQEKALQEQRLRERLAKRSKKQEEDIKQEAAKVEEEIQKDDVIASNEREVVATEAHLRLKQKAKEQDGNEGTLPTGCVGLDKQGLPITSKEEVQAADVQRKEAEERKEQMDEARFRMD
jgi:hypothetical protein